MLQKALTLLSGNAAAALLLLARNLAVAALIPLEDYGIAASFAMTMALVEMSTQFGLHQQIVQDRNGNDPRFQAALQGFQILRGVLAGGILFVLAAPIAAFLRIPEIAWAYQVMALLPVLRALQHFDIHRLNRHLRYTPMLLTGVIPAILSLIAVFPFALWLGDYRVMLFALILHESIAALTSHLLAERPYRVSLDRHIMARSVTFGWPLLLNGALLFLVMQGDKLIVGRELGMATLGLFGMGVTLTLTPTLILAKSTQNFFLPQLSRAAKSDARAFTDLTHAACQTAMLNGVILVATVSLIGVPLIDLLFGDKFAPLAPFLIWLAAIQGIRVCKSGPATAALAKGLTTNALWPNLIRVAALPVAWWLVVEGGGLWSVILTALCAEAISYALALILTKTRIHVPLKPILPSLAVSMIIIAAMLRYNATTPWLSLSIIAAGLTTLAVTMGALRRYVQTAQRQPSLEPGE
ncbi:MAG: oligosaccharide flippase family protein [Pseudomonadota bacterium]